MSVIRIKTKNLRHRENTGKIYFTVDDFEDFPECPDSNLIELLNGELFMVPSSSTLHQRISKEIEFQIESFLQKNKIAELFHAPYDVQLGKENLVIPDIAVVLNDEKDIIKEKRIEGAPSLLIEIVSSNKKRDLEDKKEIYEKHQVNEYIIIDPEEKFVLIYRFTENLHYNQPLNIKIPGTFTIKTLDDLEIILK